MTTPGRTGLRALLVGASVSFLACGLAHAATAVGRLRAVAPIRADVGQAGDVGPAGTCQAAVQGRIAWDMSGSTTWDPVNIERLCHGTTSDQPARCFDRVMHGGIDWGGGTTWNWDNAVSLCQGTTNADDTIECFQQAIARGQPWQVAIPGCARAARGPQPSSLIDDKYSSLGGGASFLGQPRTSELLAPDGIGHYRHYDGGSIYWSPRTGAHEVHGAILRRWAQLQWERGYLGYPSSDERPEAAGAISGFEHGTIEWSRADGTTHDQPGTMIPSSLTYYDPAGGSLVHATMSAGAWQWDDPYSDTPPPVVTTDWLPMNMSATEIDAMTDGRAALDLRINGQPITQKMLGRPPTDYIDTWSGYEVSGVSDPGGSLRVRIIIAGIELLSRRPPWDLTLIYAPSGAGSSSTSTARVTPSVARTSFFESRIYPTFHHDRCSTCHGFGSAAVLIAQHPQQLRTAGLLGGVGEEQTGHGTVVRCSGGCHGQVMREIVGTHPLVNFLATEWMAPGIDMHINWRQQGPLDICSTIKANLPTPQRMFQHFFQDTRVTWALESGDEPYPNLFPRKEVAPPGSVNRFKDDLTAWINGGATCSVDELVRPPGPAVIVTRIWLQRDVQANGSVDLTRVVSGRELRHWKERKDEPFVLSDMNLARTSDGRYTEGDEAYDQACVGLTIDDPRQRGLSLSAGWQENDPGMPRPLVDGGVPSSGASACMDSRTPLGTHVIVFVVTAPDPSSPSPRVLMQESVRIAIAPSTLAGGPSTNERATRAPRSAQ
jgi:hypothetical protein